jgi:uncharacterized protein (DUF1778 family)
MPDAPTKEYPLSLRLPKADVALIDRAASIKGSSRTEFMRDAAVREAEATVLDNVLIRMSPEGFAAFVEALDAPAKVIPEMLEVLRRKSPWENA